MGCSCSTLGTNGLGAATAKMLASRNPAKIYITGRKEAAAQQTISDIKSVGSTVKVEWIQCDHADLYSVVEAAEKILARESRLDVLMANAGISKRPQAPAEDRLIPPSIQRDVSKLVDQDLHPLGNC